MSDTPIPAATLPVSVHVLTWNSAQTLRASLESVVSCKEILLIDGGSTDDTVTIGDSFGARMFPQRLPGSQGQPLRDFSAARNVGLDSSTEPWVLALDSDEEMAPEALAEIADIVKRTDAPGAWWVPRQYRLPDGRIVTRASTYPNRRLYFFRKDAVEQWEKPVHERIRLKPGTVTGILKNGSIAPLPAIGPFYSKLAQYVAIEKEQSRGKGYAHWFWRRVVHTLRSRTVATIRLLWIWSVPGPVRLPLQYEMARYWYAWRLIKETCPLSY